MRQFTSVTDRQTDTDIIIIIIIYSLSQHQTVMYSNAI